MISHDYFPYALVLTSDFFREKKSTKNNMDSLKIWRHGVNILTQGDLRILPRKSDFGIFSSACTCTQVSTSQVNKAQYCKQCPNPKLFGAFRDPWIRYPELKAFNIG